MKFSKSFSLFKGIKREPNSFSYRSRFYDEEKEEREKRKKGVEEEAFLFPEEENKIGLESLIKTKCLTRMSSS
jgi:hypothetical protein